MGTMRSQGTWEREGARTVAVGQSPQATERERAVRVTDPKRQARGTPG